MSLSNNETNEKPSRSSVLEMDDIQLEFSKSTEKEPVFQDSNKVGTPSDSGTVKKRSKNKNENENKNKKTKTKTKKKRSKKSSTKHALSFGAISWNIGDNIKQEKFDSLKDTYIKKVKEKNCPDVLVVGFQEIPVNIGLGLRTRKDFKDKFYNKIAEFLGVSFKGLGYEPILTYRPPDKKNPYAFFTAASDKPKNINLFTCANLYSSVGGGYGIATYILKKTDANIRVIAVNNDCPDPKGTKGYCAVTLQANDKHNIDVINTHMPFKTIESTEKFSNNMMGWVSTHFNSPTQIILGDLNSRSILTDDCYAKNITTCDNNDDESTQKYCVIKKKLEKLNLKKSASVYKPKSSTRKMDIKKLNLEDNNCNIRERVSEKRLTDEIPTKNHHLVQILSESDALSVSMDSWFEGFQEGDIHFLPTYKRDIESGKFSLSKNESGKIEGRLPGYADRILFKHDDKVSVKKYFPLSVTGNDHLPIASLMKFYFPSGDPETVANRTGGRITRRPRSKKYAKKTYKREYKREYKRKHK